MYPTYEFWMRRCSYTYVSNYFVAFSLITGDFRSEKSNGEMSESLGAGRGASGSTRIITRLRNPDSKLSQLKSQQVAAAAHEANKLFKEGKEVCSFYLKQKSLEYE